MEDFGYRGDEEKNKFSAIAKKTFMIFATIFSLGAFIYITIHAYYFVYEEENSDIETIKSPQEPIKITEEENIINDNGIKIDHSIYEDIFGNKKANLTPEKTKIRIAPQAPIPPSQSQEKNPVISKINEKNLATEKINNDVKEEKIVVFNDKKKDLKLAPKEDSARQVLMEGTEKRDNSVAIPAKKEEKKRGIRIQLAAVNSESVAEENFKNLYRLYPKLIAGRKSYIEKVDLGKRGIFYRLQIGGFLNQIDAEEFCNRYVVEAQKSRADCIVVE
jgi:hypothetical protein